MHGSFLFVEYNGCFGHFLLNHSRYRYVRLRYTLSVGLGRMLLWKSLDISKTKTINPSADAIIMVIQREWIPDTGVYDTVKSTPSIMDDTFAHVM